MGTAPLAGEGKERRGFHKGGSLLTVGRSVGQNGSTGNCQRRAQQLVNVAGQGEIFTAGLCHSLRCVSSGTDGG